MAPQFVFPVNLQALEQEYEDGRLCVQNSVRVASLLSSELEELVKGVSFDLSDKELFCVEEQDVFDRVYSLVRAFSGLTSSCKFTIVESLRSNFSVLLPSVDALACHDEDESMHLDRISSLLNAFKIYTFFLINIVLAEESNINSNNDSRAVANTRKKKHVNTWNWEPQRGRVLNLIANSLEINLPLLFGSSTPDESYLSFVVKNTFSMFENGALLKDTGTKDALCRIIGTIATKYRYVEQCCASVLHLIHKYDFVVTHIADAVAWAEKKYADGSLASSLIREVGRTNPKDYIKDTAGAENVGRFLVELADKLPKLVATNVGILVPHFGGESYKMRNALIGVLGKLIMKAFKDIEGEMSSKCVRLRAKQAMLEILLERCRDASAYTRSRVLQVWAELCEEHSISIGLWNEVASVAAGRLEDKSAIVRKSALNLLIVMLQHNPFGPQLRIAPFEATLDQYKNKLAEQEQNISVRSLENNSASHSESCNTDGEIDNGNANIVAEELDSLPDSCTPHVENVVTHKESSLPDIGNLEQIKALVASLESGLRFSKCLTSIMPTLVQLMASSSSTDVENSILLLMRCRQFQIDGSEDSLRKMLPLVFSQDKSIYEAVENAFVTIYIRKSAAETAKNLANLSVESNIGDLAALESIVGALVSKGDISSSAISALWDFFCFNVSGTTAEESRGALSVLCMAAKSSPGILSSHVQDIIDIGFGRWAKLEPLFARTACIALERLSNEDRKKLLLTNGRKVIGVLESLITGSWLSQDSWYAAADKAISAIYILHPTPETIALGLLKKSLDCVFDFSGGDELQSDIENCSINNLATVEVAKLSRFLFVASHIAMNHMVYVESCARKIRKQRAKAHRTEADGQIANSMVPPKENGINAELGLAASEDALLDSLEERAQAEIVSGSSAKKCLIGSCASFLSKLCRNFSLMHKYPELQASAMLALCRFMIIDANFCDANLQLLFTVVENAPSEVVRSNCTIALGDLAVRFPNLLEPWTENMYARLQDTSTSVRKNAVLVLSHLILNDMMKVKGYINEMAIRLEDGDDRISNLAKLFFHELSKKGNNPIYNLLPDILGRLSGQNLDRECFYNIMQFLIGSIKKDKQMEALVEKLCHRFTGVTDVRQWEYIAYCLSQLTFTDKGIKKLIDLFKTYEHVLSEDCIMDHFKSILSKGKKFAKPELKACLEEFEEKLNKIHMEKKEQEVTARNAQVYQQKIDGLKSSAVAQDFKEESGEVDECEDGEVIDSTTKESPCSPKGTLCCKKEAEESSCTSSELVESDSEVTKFQSVKSKRGASNNRAIKADVKSQTVSTRRSLRSNRR